MVSPNVRASKQTKWRANASIEQKKLLSSLTCKLAGSNSPLPSRTRAKRVPFARLLSPNILRNDEDSISEDEITPKIPKNLFGSSASTTPSTITTSSSKRRVKPPDSRVILEVNPLKGIMERHIVCPKCASAVKVSFPSKCIATSIRIDCIDDMCDYVEVEKPVSASPALADDAGSASISRNSNFAINILYVLSFLSKGDGGSEAAHLLGLLGLPNSTTMDGSSFGAVEQQIGRSVLQKVADEVVYERNLGEEVKLHYKGAKYEEDDAHRGKLLFDLWREGKLNDKAHLWPRLTLSGDMGWQGRASGMQFNSLSGDAILVGSLTRKPCAWYVCSRSCSFCKGWKRGTGKNEEVPEHNCQKNWNGSAGAMEPIAILEMVKLLSNHYSVVTECIITDDDSSIKTKLKWNNADTMINNNLDEPPHVFDDKGKKKVRPDKGELPINMPEPTFVADPNHRKKTFAGDLYRFEKVGVDLKQGMTKMDVLRLTQNFAYMVRSLPSLDRSEWKDAAEAVIEHHFDNHDYCGLWCHRKKQSDEERAKKKKIYRSKEEDKKLYHILKQKIERFITEEALDEVGHGMDTLVNESFNNTVAWIAPKNKVYSSSDSLKNRIAICLGINGLGTLEYYRLLFDRLGISVSDDVVHYINVISKKRATRLAKSKTPVHKTTRQLKYQLNLLTKTVIAKREKSKREGTYERGMGVGVNGGYTEEELAKAKTLFPTDYKARKVSAAAAKRKSLICRYCHKTGHATNRSKKCDEHQAWLASKAAPGVNLKQPPTAAAAGVIDKPLAAADEDSDQKQTQRDAEECELMDQLPFDDDSSDDEFFDAMDCI